MKTTDSALNPALASAETEIVIDPVIEPLTGIDVALRLTENSPGAVKVRADTAAFPPFMMLMFCVIDFPRSIVPKEIEGGLNERAPSCFFSW